MGRGFMRSMALLLTFGLFALAGCGSGGTKTVVKTVSGPEATTPTTPTPTQPEKPAFKSCDDKGINYKKLKEGRCKDQPGGVTDIVVNRGSTLKMPELNVTVVNTQLTKTISTDVGTERAGGMFFIVTLRVLNKLDDPGCLR
jgi:hypothetical protein